MKVRLRLLPACGPRCTPLPGAHVAAHTLLRMRRDVWRSGTRLAMDAM